MPRKLDVDFEEMQRDRNAGALTIAEIAEKYSASIATVMRRTQPPANAVRRARTKSPAVTHTLADELRARATAPVQTTSGIAGLGAMIAELRAKRDALEKAIAVLEALL